jgi:DNA-damage-inducible protein D
LEREFDMEIYEVENAFEGDPPAFEMLAQENGFRFWSASDLAAALGYNDVSKIKKAIDKARSVCALLDISAAENIAPLERDGKKDFRLSRFACYLTVMNLDPRSNQTVAQAQAFFAKLAEIFGAEMQHGSEVDRLLIRGEITEQEKSLSGAAKAGGIEDYAKFQNAGYLGLYNMPLWQLEKYKKFAGKKPMLDHMGRDELAANLFRLTQTEAKIRNENTRGQKSLEDAATTVGRIVRQAIEEISGRLPEDMPLVGPIGPHKERHQGRAERVQKVG